MCDVHVQRLVTQQDIALVPINNLTSEHLKRADTLQVFMAV